MGRMRRQVWKRTSGRGVALLLLLAGLVCASASREAAAQAGAASQKVAVTLVRWPYT